MFSHLESSVSAIESKNLTISEALTELRKLTIDEFGQVLSSLPNQRWPNLSDILPAMTPEAIQKEWTGSSGDTLLRQSASFMNLVSSTFAELTGKPIRGVNVLDFGCGWGRLLRLLSFYNDPQFNYGCDAWDVSLNHSRSAKIDRVVRELKKSESIPTELPFPDVKFSLVYAFSIFTHLSERSAIACMSAIRQKMMPDGIAIISVRPVEFWDFNQTIPLADRNSLRKRHEDNKVAFHPINENYGDTSIPLSRFPDLFPGWEIARSGATFVDPYQVFVALRPV
jgi:SAM-dependent methyltransferase